MKKFMTTLIVLFALLGFSGTVAYAAGYITWGGTNDYHMTLEHMDNIEIGINDLKQARSTLISERDNLVNELNNSNQSNEQLSNHIIDLGNQIDSLEQDIVALEKRISDGMTTRGQLQQAEKDMNHVEERAREVMGELNE